MTDHILEDYNRRFPMLVDVSERLERHLSDLLLPRPRVDRITARAKSPERFLAKAQKESVQGGVKYANPQYEIQDQIGARITVFYLPDTVEIQREISKYFKFIEVQQKAPSSEAEFGYFGLHFILKMPSDVVPDEYEDDIPEFFELQIKTLFQHAWSEAHHDLGYKSLRDLHSDEQRKVAFTAAQAWGADAIFAELSKSLVYHDNDP